MKKFKRFLCIPLLVLFTMTLLTLPVAAAVTVLLPDGKPAASITFTFQLLDRPTAKPSMAFYPNSVILGPVNVTTNDQGVFEYPAGSENSLSNRLGYIYLRTSTPSKLVVAADFRIDQKTVSYNQPVSVQLKSF